MGGKLVQIPAIPTKVVKMLYNMYILSLSSPHKMVEVPIQKILMKCDAVEGQKRNVIPAMVEVSRYLPSAGTSHH